MTQLTMYPAQVNSPETTLSAPIDSTTPNIPVYSASILPPAPNLMTIRVNDYDKLPETIYYPTDAVGNIFYGVTRGFEGIQKAFPQGATVCRLLTAYDIDTLKYNIENREVKDLADTDIDSPEDGEVLVYSEDKWMNSTIDGGTA